MYNNLINFLVENNYARNETGALKILCSASDMFYDYIVLESSSEDRKKLAELQDKLEHLKRKNAPQSRIDAVENQIKELRNKFNEAPPPSEGLSAAAGKRAQERKEALRDQREQSQASARAELVRSRGEEELAKMQNREPNPTPATPETVKGRQNTWTSGGANKPRDVIRTPRTPGTNPDYVNPDERRDTPDVRQQYTYTRADRTRAGRTGNTSPRFTKS